MSNERFHYSRINTVLEQMKQQPRLLGVDAADANTSSGETVRDAMHFGPPMVHSDPFDSPMVWTRNTSTTFSDWHTTSLIATIQEQHSKYSCGMSHFIEAWATDHPDANKGTITAMDTGMYMIGHNPLNAWFALFHQDLFHEKGANGTTIGANIEGKRFGIGGSVIAFNAMSDDSVGGLPVDVGYNVQGNMIVGMRRETPGIVLQGANGKNIIRTDASNSQFFGPVDNLSLSADGYIYGKTIRQGPGDLLQTFTADGHLLRTIYADQYGSHIWGTNNNIITRGDGSTEVNGDIRIKGRLIINGKVFS